MGGSNAMIFNILCLFEFDEGQNTCFDFCLTVAFVLLIT